VTGADDVTELTMTVNTMLDRLQWAFDTQQQFLDDAGHELRTPLTIVRGHLEVLDVGDPLEVSATRDIVLDELDRMARLVDDLVLLAQARRPDFVRFEPVDLDRLIREALDKAQALADRRWVLDAALPVVVAADAQRLTRPTCGRCAKLIFDARLGPTVVSCDHRPWACRPEMSGRRRLGCWSSGRPCSGLSGARLVNGSGVTSASSSALRLFCCCR
jgi:hypothetical protein